MGRARAQAPGVDTLVLLAAGRSRRFGGAKQLTGVGPRGECLLDYLVYDAWRARWSAVVVITSADLEDRMRSHVRSWPAGLSTRVVVQPEASTLGAPDRRTPWGTGHALLAAEPYLDRPFVVANADDFYGRGAVALAGAFHGGPAGRVSCGLVGYRLDVTLSAHGGVSRAVCEVDDHGVVRSITELLEVERTGQGIRGRSARSGAAVALSGTELTSMNFWILPVAVLDCLARAFEDFLATRRHDPRAEFLLSTAIDGLLRAGEISVQALATEDTWFGLTRREDREEVSARLEALVRTGIYPSPLFDRTGAKQGMPCS